MFSDREECYLHRRKGWSQSGKYERRDTRGNEEIVMENKNKE